MRNKFAALSVAALLAFAAPNAHATTITNAQLAQLDALEAQAAAQFAQILNLDTALSNPNLTPQQKYPLELQIYSYLTNLTAIETNLLASYEVDRITQAHADSKRTSSPSANWLPSEPVCRLLHR